MVTFDKLASCDGLGFAFFVDGQQQLLLTGSELVEEVGIDGAVVGDNLVDGLVPPVVFTAKIRKTFHILRTLRNVFYVIVQNKGIIGTTDPLAKLGGRHVLLFAGGFPTHI